MLNDMAPELDALLGKGTFFSLQVELVLAQFVEVYSQCLQRVKIETKKSYRGSAEFAKRFRIHGLETGFSPVYIRCLMNEHLSSIWPCCFTTYVPCEEVLHSLQSGLGGAGYRALTRLDHHRSKHYARVGTVYTKSLYPRGSLELWLGRGRFLNPYLRGLILDLLRSEIKPKEKPGELFASEGVNLSGLEWSILCVWVRDWLRYCQRYYCTALSPDANIEQFFDAPVVMNYWKIKRKDPWPFKRRYIGSNQDMLVRLSLESSFRHQRARGTGEGRIAH